MTKQNARRCIFCGNSPTSREHMYPQWVTALLANDPRRFPLGPKEQVIIRGGEETHRWATKRPLDFVTRTVCGSCNNGWMSEIEGKAIPYIKPMIEASQAVTLDQEAQRIVGTWMVLRAMIFRSARNQPIPDAEQEWLTWFYANRTVPPRWIVWIGVYDGLLIAHYETNAVHPYTSSQRDLLNTSDFRGIVLGSIIGHLAFKVAGLGRASVLDKTGSALLRIAPPKQSEVEWPPEAVITDSNVIKFFALGLRSEPAIARYWDEIQNSG